jgi:hypothetical protein
VKNNPCRGFAEQQPPVLLSPRIRYHYAIQEIKAGDTPMAMSIFDDKSKQPTKQMLAKAIGKQYQLWTEIAEYVVEKYPKAIEEWKYFTIKKYGWSFRIKDKKRNIIYMGPRENSLTVAFLFSDKGVQAVQESSLPQSIKDELRNAKKYPEGRGIRLQVKTSADVANIKTLVDIKLAN